MDFVNTFLYWLAIFAAFNLNVVLFVGVYRVMQDRLGVRHPSREIYSPMKRTEGYPRHDFGPELDLPEIDQSSLDADGKPFWERDNGASQRTSLVMQNQPDFKVETSFGSGKLGRLEKK